MLTELNYILSLPDRVWELVAHVSGIPNESHMLRNTSVSVAHSSLGFVYKDSFRQLSLPPLKWTQGDIIENVRTIATMPMNDITDKATQKLRTLLDIGFESELIVENFTNAIDIPASTSMVEQGHGRVTPVLRQHKQIGSQFLCSAALLTQTRSFFTAWKEQKVVEKLKSKLEAYDAKVVNRINAQNMFCGARIDQSSSSADPTLAGSSFKEVSASMTQVARSFNDLSFMEKAEWEEIARKRRQEVAVEHGVQKATLQMSLQEAEEAVVERQADRRNHLSCMKLSDTEIEEMVSTWSQGVFRRDDVQKALDSHLVAPSVPAAEDQAWIVAGEKDFEIENDVVPWWVRNIAINRDFFQGTAISVTGSDKVYVIVYISGSPYGAILLWKPSCSPLV